jgi:hypothetical protein
VESADRLAGTLCGADRRNEAADHHNATLEDDFNDLIAAGIGGYSAWACKVATPL